MHMIIIDLFKIAIYKLHKKPFTSQGGKFWEDYFLSYLDSCYVNPRLPQIEDFPLL